MDRRPSCGRGRAAPARLLPPLLLPLLLLLLALPAPARGRGLPAAAHARAARGLLALKAPRLTADLCDASMPNCTDCTFRWRRGSYVLLCTACRDSYRLDWASNSCVFDGSCGTGLIWDPVAGACGGCGIGYYCVAAPGVPSMRSMCPPGTSTLTAYAKGPEECLSKPGYGWERPEPLPGNISPCPRGFFSPKFIRGPPSVDAIGLYPYGCRPCPGNLTTASPGANSTTMCVAPAGYYYNNGKSSPCPLGTYKPKASNEDCTPCPNGLTTSGNTSIRAADCNVVEPGWSVSANGTGAQCDETGYNPGGQAWAPGTDVPCLPCNNGSRSQSLGSVDPSACVAPPGWGYDEATNSSVICPRGYFKDGWNTDPCQSCGINIDTESVGSTVADACVIPAGWGSFYGGGRWKAYPCPVDTFGADVPTPGQVRVDCLACVDHMTTLNQTMCTSEHQCVTRPGYGYYSKEVRLCRVGEWSAGLSRDGCNHCPPGFSTAGLGSTSAADCDVAPGYTSDGRGGAVACKRGFYKVTLGPDPCLQCPNSTYTADTGSDVLSDCNMCLPGRGAPRIDPGAPACDMCGLNTWSAGLGMMGCAACAPGQVSKVGSSRQEDCVLQFISNGGASSSHFDFVAMAASTLTAFAPATSAGACQAECARRAGAADGCQYFVYREAWEPGRKCLLRLLGLASPSAWTNADPAPKVLFQIKLGTYAAYFGDPSDWTNLGTVMTYHTSLDAAKAACEARIMCVGIKFSRAGGAAPWAVFSGGLWESTSGKVRIHAPAINPWTPPGSDKAVIMSLQAAGEA